MAEKLSRDTAICDRDCFNCPFPDCVREDLVAEDYADARELEGYIHPPTLSEIRAAAKQKAYYEENREAIAARNGRILYDLRHEHGMSQAALGRVLGISQPTVSKWETGAVPFDMDRVLAYFEGRRATDG